MPAKKRKDSQNKLVAMMVVRNEANRYLKIVLDQVSTFVDCIVILDDASTDATPEVCASYRKVILHRNKEPLFFHHSLQVYQFYMAFFTPPQMLYFWTSKVP